jgi:hypothetical protein
MKGCHYLGLAALLVMSELAIAQSDLSPAIFERVEGWKACVDVAAKRYAASNEPAENVARIAILSCRPDLGRIGEQMRAESVNMTFQTSFVDRLEKGTLEKTAVQVMEMRLRR